MSYAVGIDLGGTKTDILLRHGSVTHSLEVAGGNLRMDDPVAIAQRIAGALRQIISHTVPLRLCMGAAGGGDRDASQALVEALHNELPGLRHATVLSDQRIAWEAAFNGEPGIIVIAGTGSGCFMVDAEGRAHRTGGWGPRVGDPGSGRSLGAAALRLALTASESGTYSLLAEKVARHVNTGAALFGPDAAPPADLLRIIYAPDFSVARLAPMVFEALEENCPDARSVAMDEANALAAQCHRLVRSHPPRRKRIALMGGLTGSAAYVLVLTAALEQIIPDYRIQTPGTKPVTGALRLAMAGSK